MGGEGNGGGGGDGGGGVGGWGGRVRKRLEGCREDLNASGLRPLRIWYLHAFSPPNCRKSLQRNVSLAGGGWFGSRWNVVVVEPAGVACIRTADCAVGRKLLSRERGQSCLVSNAMCLRSVPSALPRICFHEPFRDLPVG